MVIWLESTCWQRFFKNVFAIVDENLIFRFACIQGIGDGCIFVRIDGVFERCLCPHATALIEIDRDEFADTFFWIFGRYEFDLKAWRQMKGGFLFLGRFGFGVFDRFHFWICGTLIDHSGRQFLDYQIFELYEQFSTAMGLQPDHAIDGNARIGLGIIECGHTIDPRTNAATFAHNAVVIPVPIVRFESGGIDWLADDFVAPRFIIKLAPPVLASIDLVAAHFRIVRHTRAADLHARIHESFTLREFDF